MTAALALLETLLDMAHGKKKVHFFFAVLFFDRDSKKRLENTKY